MKQIVIVAAVLTAAGAAHAGSKLLQPVHVNKTSSRAEGTMADSRSMGGPSYLRVRSFKGGALLQAMDITGASAMCVTSDPEFIAVARSATPDSWVSFAWDVSGTCIDVVVGHWSDFAPLTP